MTPDQAVRHVTATDPAFAVTTARIRGADYRVFANVPPTLPALLEASRARQGDGAADYLVFANERQSYDAFCTEIRRAAHALAARYGVTKGTRVAIAMRNCPEFLILFMAISTLGGVVVFLNAWWTRDEIDYALGDSGARLVFGDGERVARLLPLAASRGLTVIGVREGEAAAPAGYRDLVASAAGADPPTAPIDTDDDFAIMYSSGSTGHPKGVVLTHRGAVNAVFSWLLQAVIAPLVNPPEKGAPEPPRPAVLVTTPLFHVTALHPVFLLSLPAGAKLVLMGKWDAGEAARIIRREGVTRFLGVPTQSADLMEHVRRSGEALPSLAFIGAGGAKRPAPQVAPLAKTFPGADIATGWGMTETNALGIGMAGDDYVARPGAVGRPYPPLQDLRLLDDDGNDVPEGATGELAIRSVAVMRGYLNQPKETARTIRDGWLLTGDLAAIDGDGIVTIVERKKSIIIRGGENISCLEVEDALHRHPAVREACVFSVPDARLGEVPGAMIALAGGASADTAALRAFLAPHLAPFKIPDAFWFTRRPLARGATDKIDRRAVRLHCLETPPS